MLHTRNWLDSWATVHPRTMVNAYDSKVILPKISKTEKKQIWMGNLSYVTELINWNFSAQTNSANVSENNGTKGESEHKI